eukprot:2442028-Alexandrium_andersonii.AAC.1
MSASLVGSEMCIRDSCGVRRIAALAGLGRIADRTLDTSRCKDPSLRAVSYTHLTLPTICSV